MRMFGIYHLLCDHCNLLFTGFAFPWNLRNSGRHKAKNRAKQSEARVSSQQTLSKTSE